MSLKAKDEFIAWLDELEKVNGWTDYRLSAETGLSSSVFSKARQGILPKWDALVRIADAFRVSPITAFRKAGLLPPGQEDETTFEDWKQLLSQMTPDDQEELRKIAEMKLNKRQKDGALKRLKPKKA
jgi:transcriptional regulator with XRE-family HTH domain